MGLPPRASKYLPRRQQPPRRPKLLLPPPRRSKLLLPLKLHPKPPKLLPPKLLQPRKLLRPPPRRPRLRLLLLNQPRPPKLLPLKLCQESSTQEEISNIYVDSAIPSFFNTQLTPAFSPLFHERSPQISFSS